MSRKGEPHSIRPVPRSRTRSQKALSQEGSSPGEATFSAQSEPESSLAPDDEEEEEEEEEYSNGSDNLLQTYLDDRYSHRRRNYYIRLLVARFVYSDQFDATKAEQAQQTIIKLAEHEKVFQKLLSYTVEDVKRDFLKVTYSTIRLWQMVEFMGVVVKSSIPASELAKALEETALLPKFQLLSRDEIDVDDFADDFDAEKEIQEMPSTVEAQARFRISTILKKIIHLFRQDEIIGVGEELLLGHWKSKTGPIEIRHRTGDGIVRSAFVSGRVDYVCAKGPSIRALNLPMWSIADALSRIRNETFQVTHEAHFADFLAGLEQNFSEALVKYDSVSDDLSWDACVLEAKNMNKRFSFKSTVPSGAGYVHETSDERTDESLGKSSRPSGRRDIVNDIRADHQSTQPQESGLYNAFLGRSPRRLVNARIHGSEILSPLEVTAQNPVRWIDACDDLNTLADRTYLGSAPLDQYLLAVFTLQPGPRKARYIPFNFLHSTNPDDQEIANFRRLIGHQGEVEPLPFETVVGVIHETNHYFVVVVLPDHKEVHILGKGISKREQYEDTIGWVSWKKHLSGIALYYGWEGMSDYRILCTDWPQNGFDCGPIACQVVIYILRYGFKHSDDGFWAEPYLPCAHGMRHTMVATILDETEDSLAAFRNHLRRPDGLALLGSLFGPELEEIQQRLQNYQHDPEIGRGIATRLAENFTKCRSCKHTRGHGIGSTGSLQGIRRFLEPSQEPAAPVDYHEEVNRTSLDDDKDVINESSFDDDEDLIAMEKMLLGESQGGPATQAVTPRERIRSALTLSEHIQLAGDSQRGESTDIEDQAQGINTETRRDPLGREVGSDQTGLSDEHVRTIPGNPQPGRYSDPHDTTKSKQNDTQELEVESKQSMQKNLRTHLPQVVAQCLAINEELVARSKASGIVKFVISSSNDWLFGLVDCSGGSRRCYITDTLTIRTEEDLKDMLFLLMAWIMIPGSGLFPYFPKSDNEIESTRRSTTRKTRFV